MLAVAAAGHAELDCHTNAPATVATLKTEIFHRFPALARFGASLLVAVNEEYATAETSIADGSEVAFFPPVSGGAGEASTDFYELTTDPIDIGAVARRVIPPDASMAVRWPQQSCASFP